MPSLGRLKQSLNAAWKTPSRGCSYQTTKLQRCPQYERHQNFCACERFCQRLGDTNQRGSSSAVRQGKNEDMCLQADVERSEASDFQGISRTVALKRERDCEVHQNLLQATASMVKGILKVEQKLPSEQSSVRFLSPEFWVEPSSRDKHPSQKETSKEEVKNQRRPNAQPLDQRSAKWKEEQEEIARHQAYMLRKELFRIEEHDEDVQNTNVFTRHVPTKATLQRVVIHTRDGGIYQKRDVHCASLYMMGVFSFTEKRPEDHA